MTFILKFALKTLNALVPSENAPGMEESEKRHIIVFEFQEQDESSYVAVSGLTFKWGQLTADAINPSEECRGY